MAAANNGNPKSNRSKEPVPPLVIEQVAEASEPPASRKVATVDERQSEHDDASPQVSNEAAENQGEVGGADNETNQSKSEVVTC